MESSFEKWAFQGQRDLASISGYCRTAILSIPLALSCISCGEATSEVSGPLKVATWWKSDGENRAARALFDNAEKALGFEIDHLEPSSGKDEQDTVLVQSFEQGDPPHTFQTNAGQHLLRWVERGPNLLKSLPENFSAEARFHDVNTLGIWDAATESLRGIPLGIHQLNVVFMNEAILNDDQLALIEDENAFNVDRLIELCNSLRDNRQTGEAALALPFSEGWALSLIVLENLLVSREGVDAFSGVLQPVSGGETELYEVALDFAKLIDCAGSETGNWAAASDLFVAGKAGMVIMGDWMRAELNRSKLDGSAFDTPEFAWRTMSLIGPPDPANPEIPSVPFVFTADTFPFVRGRDMQPEMMQLLRFMSEPETQIEFSKWKGGIPALDLSGDSDSLEELTEQQRGTLDRFMRADRVLAISGQVVPEVESLIGEAFVDFAREIRANMPDFESNAFVPEADARFNKLVNRLKDYSSYGR